MDIVVRGARDHNLRDVDVRIPLGRLTVLCGRSGSGKSSLAFDTLHREGQRRYLEALLQGGGRLPRPDVASIEHLPPTIGLDQRERAPAASLTVAGLCEIELVLAVLFGRAGTAHCPRCQRSIHPRSHDAIVAAVLAEPHGERLTIEAPVDVTEGGLEEIRRAGFSRVRVDGRVVRLDELRRLDERATLRVVVDRLRNEPERRGRMVDAVRLAARAGGGVVVVTHGERELCFVDRPYCVHDALELPACEPSRFRLHADRPHLGLDDAARAVRVGQAGIEALLGTVDALVDALGALPADPRSQPAVDELHRRAATLQRLGLGGLRLGAAASAVSRGEGLRLRLARQASSGVSGVLYVLDEPASGLDDVSAAAVIDLCRDLVDIGNTVLVVDHHPALVRAADHLIEFGPGAGPDGGQVIYAGPPGSLSGTPTAAALAGALQVARAPGGTKTRTLAGITFDAPGVTVLTGPSGAGKSRTLAAIAAAAAAEERVLEAGADHVARARRSNAATFTGLWTTLRELLAQTREARIRGIEAGWFSLNRKGGRCEACGGEGEIRVVMEPLPDLWVRCEVCEGRRFSSDVLAVRWKGHTADELLRLTVGEAYPVLAGHPGLERPLRALLDVGLGHVPLGRGSDTLSGGEARRLRLARELARRRGPSLVLADDPGLGLHPADVVELMQALQRLADEGSAVVLASCDPLVVGGAGRVVDVVDLPR